MRNVRVLQFNGDAQLPVTTGALRLGDNWPGLYVDNPDAWHLAHAIQMAVAHLDAGDVMRSAALSIAVNELRSIADLILKNVCR